MDAIDPANPVAQLCAAGMDAEARGDFSAARNSFESAWAARTDACDASIAAHFLARAQTNLRKRHAWNSEALRAAEEAAAAGDARVDGFFASLHLNMGRSCEDVGELEAAAEQYAAARAGLANLPESPYTDVVRRGVEAAWHRMRRREVQLDG